MHLKNTSAGHTATSNDTHDEKSRTQQMKSGKRTMISDNKARLAPLGALISLTLLAGCIDGNGTSATVGAVAGDTESMSGLDAESTSAKSDEENKKREDESHEKEADKKKTTKRAYYGDYSSNRAFVIDVDSMKVEKVISNTGKGPYETDKVSNTTAYVLNRDDTSINVVDLHENRISGTIDLNFKPRSIVPSPSGRLGILSGKSQPWATLIDLKTHEISADGFRDSDYNDIADFGGGNATGHPYWISDEHFLMPDRTERTIELYSIESATPVAKLATSSSVHHVFKIGADYFAVLEGKRGATEGEAISPGLIKFGVDLKTGKMTLDKELLLADLPGKPASFGPKQWGAHHASVHPDGKSIYIGSYEGNMFVIDKDSFTLIDSFEAGLGLGHVAFVPERNIAITTNHYARFKTIVDVSDPRNNRIIKNLTVAQPDSDNSGKRMQSHTSHTGPDGKYFYSVSSRDGVFYAIDLDQLTVAGSVTMENAYPLMGTLVIGGKDDEQEQKHRDHL